MVSCEEVVELDLKTAEPRLIIDATFLKFQDGQSISRVILSTTFGYYAEEIPYVNDAEVSVIDGNGNIHVLENIGNGTFSASIEINENMEYQLLVIYNNEVYTATTQYVPVPPIDYVQQTENGGFLGNQPEVTAYVTDPEDEENFYFLEVLALSDKGYDVWNDQYVNGNSYSFSYSDENLQAGDNITFKLQGINEATYNYYFMLLQQNGNSGGPFSTPPATVHGNIINETNPDNYALGYFRISEINSVVYTYE